MQKEDKEFFEKVRGMTPLQLGQEQARQAGRHKVFYTIAIILGAMAALALAMGFVAAMAPPTSSSYAEAISNTKKVIDSLTTALAMSFLSLLFFTIFAIDSTSHRHRCAIVEDEIERRGLQPKEDVGKPV